MNYCSIEDAWGNDFNNNVNFSYNNTSDSSNIINTKQLENEIIENEIIENEIIEKKNRKKLKKNILKGGNINSLLSTQEIYIILGLILLFIIDTFSRLGKKIY